MNIITCAFKPWGENSALSFRAFNEYLRSDAGTPVINMETTVDKPYKAGLNLHMNAIWKLWHGSNAQAKTDHRLPKRGGSECARHGGGFWLGNVGESFNHRRNHGIIVEESFPKQFGEKIPKTWRPGGCKAVQHLIWTSRQKSLFDHPRATQSIGPDLQRKRSLVDLFLSPSNSGASGMD